LLRAGHTPKSGEYSKNVAMAIDFVCTSVEKSDSKSLYVTDIRGTRVQTKIGTYVDTFLAAQLLAEVKGLMPDKKGGERVVAALNKIIGKMEDNQMKNGTWANQGWAPVVGQAIASRGLNRARQAGVMVKGDVLDRA